MTVVDQDVLLRPDDHELVKATGARLRRATSVPLVFGGLRQGGAIPMTVTLGHRTSDLRTIDVRPRAWSGWSNVAEPQAFCGSRLWFLAGDHA